MTEPETVSDENAVKAAPAPVPAPVWYRADREIWATRVIISINAAVLALMIVFSRGTASHNPGIELLLQAGANFAPLTILDHQYWRMITCAFVHVGAVHFAMNMLVLWQVGKLAERLFGTLRFSIIYLLAALGGSLLSLFFNPQIVSSGASGAVFGAYGGLLAFFIVHKSQFPKGYLEHHSKSVMVFVVFNLIFGAVTPAIDNAAHIGGLIAGFLAGLALCPNKPSDERIGLKQFVYILTLCAALFGAFQLDVKQIAQNDTILLSQQKKDAFNNYQHTVSEQLQKQAELLRELSKQPDAALPQFVKEARAATDERLQRLTANKPADPEVAQLHATVVRASANLLAALNALDDYYSSPSPDHLNQYKEFMGAYAKQMSEYQEMKEEYAHKYKLKFLPRSLSGSN